MITKVVSIPNTYTKCRCRDLHVSFVTFLKGKVCNEFLLLLFFSYSLQKIFEWGTWVLRFALPLRIKTILLQSSFFWQYEIYHFSIFILVYTYFTFDQKSAWKGDSYHQKKHIFMHIITSFWRRVIIWCDMLLIMCKLKVRVLKWNATFLYSLAWSFIQEGLG